MNLDIKSPYDGALLNTIKLASNDEALNLLDIAYETFLDKKKFLPKHQRVSILNNLINLMTEKCIFNKKFNTVW